MRKHFRHSWSNARNSKDFKKKKENGGRRGRDFAEESRTDDLCFYLSSTIGVFLGAIHKIYVSFSIHRKVRFGYLSFSVLDSTIPVQWKWCWNWVEGDIGKGGSDSVFGFCLIAFSLEHFFFLKRPVLVFAWFHFFFYLVS